MDNTLKLFSFYFGKPCKNITFEKYDNSEYIILGHFTTSVFLDSILENGLLAPQYTENISNKEIIQESDKNYVYLSGHFDRTFSRNAIKKFGGKEVLLLIKIKKDSLELDDVNSKYSKNGIDLTSSKNIYNALIKELFSQCRTKEKILPSQIIEVLTFNF